MSDDALGVIFEGLRNVLEPRIVVDCSSTCKGLQALTQPLRQQLRADHGAAAELCLKLVDFTAAPTRSPRPMLNCKELRLAKVVDCIYDGLTAAELDTLGTLGSVLPALEELTIFADGLDSVQRLTAGLGAGALPALTRLTLIGVPVGDAGASALAAVLTRGALPRLKTLNLVNASIGDAGLVALAPALRRRPALERIGFPGGQPLGDEGLAALVAPPPPAGAPPPPTGVLTNLKTLDLNFTQITDAGCATLTAALDSGALPALKHLNLKSGAHPARDELCLCGIPASAAATEAVRAALAKPRAAVSS